MSATQMTSLFEELARITTRPEPFSIHTIDTLWTDPHVAEQMLRYHLDADLDSASRRHGFVEASVAWIVDEFDLAAGRRVVDLGCGPGLYTNRLATAGARVTGVDLSERSIRHAERVAAETGVDVDHRVADYLDDPPVGPFDLALLIYCDFCALSPDRRRRLLDNVRRLLAPGGVLLFDVVSFTRFLAIEEGTEFAESYMDGFWAPEPYYGFQTTFTYRDRWLVLDRYDIVERDRSWCVANWLQHYDPDSLADELAEAGFEVARLLGDVAGADYDPTSEEFAVIARPA